MSPSAEKLFNATLADMKGKHLSELIPLCDDFISVRDTGKPVMGKTRRLKDNLVAEQNIVRVEGQALLVAIMRDITEHEKRKAEIPGPADRNPGTNPRSGEKANARGP